MEQVTSPDGTPIAFHRRGAGVPLVLVHGTGAANPAVAWTAVLPALEARFTVYALDRRGRGGSGDGRAYALEREVEDVVAVVQAAGEPAHLLGHSFGGLCAMEAARLLRNLRKLILYEPLSVSPPGEPLYPAGFIDRLQALLEAGEREQVLAAFYREVVGMDALQVEQLRSSPAWPARLDAAHTLPREMRAEEQYRLDARRFRGFHAPTLLLTGADSPQPLKAGIEAARTLLPESRLAVMPGQEHIAMYTAPELFLREVLAFLSGPEEP
jgi:pimeloyl-ACP methyl ester carboxylesterase